MFLICLSSSSVYLPHTPLYMYSMYVVDVLKTDYYHFFPSCQICICAPAFLLLSYCALKCNCLLCSLRTRSRPQIWSRTIGSGVFSMLLSWSASRHVVMSSAFMKTAFFNACNPAPVPRMLHHRLAIRSATWIKVWIIIGTEKESKRADGLAGLCSTERKQRKCHINVSWLIWVFLPSKLETVSHSISYEADLSLR